MSAEQIQYTGSGYDSDFVHDPSTGYTGIGTGSPSGLMEAAADVDGSGNNFVARNTSSGAGAQARYNLYNDLGGGGALLMLTSSGYASPYTSALVFSNDLDGPVTFFANAAEAMRIQPNGNIGIGTTSPAYTLDVNGLIRANIQSLLSGAVSRDLVSKIMESPSLLDFGCMGDGVTNDTANAQAAINAVTASGAIGVLRVPGGKNFLIGSLTIPSNLYLVGDGPTSKFTSAGGLADGVGLFDINGSSNVALQNFFVEGGVTTPVGYTYGEYTDPSDDAWTQGTTIWIHSGSSNIKIQDVSINHTGGYAIYWFGNVSDVNIVRPAITNSRPALLGVDGDTNYFGWNGGIFGGNDGETNFFSDINVEDAFFQNVTGHCFWTRSQNFLNGTATVTNMSTTVTFSSDLTSTPDWPEGSLIFLGGVPYPIASATISGVTLLAEYPGPTSTSMDYLYLGFMNRNVTFTGYAEDHLGDMSQPGDVDIYYENIDSRRCGYICTNGATTDFTTAGNLVDSSPSATRIPKWLASGGQKVPPVVADTTGLLLNATRSFRADCVNGVLCSGDGMGSSTIQNFSGTSAFASTDPLANAGICGPGPGGSGGVNLCSGIAPSNGNNLSLAGLNLNVTGGVLNGFGYNSVGMFACRDSILSNVQIIQPTGVDGQLSPIVLGNIGTGPYQRAYGNKVSGCQIDWPDPENPAIIEEDGGFDFQSTDINIVDSSNTTTASALFWKDPLNSSSTSGPLLLSSVTPQAAKVVQAVCQVEGKGASSADFSYKIYQNTPATVPANNVLIELTAATAYVPSLALVAAQWQMNYAYSAGQTIIDSNGHVQLVTHSGTSGTSAPDWNTMGGTTTGDGTDGLIWFDLGATDVVDSMKNLYANSLSIGSGTGGSGTGTLVVDTSLNVYATSVTCGPLTCSGVTVGMNTGKSVTCYFAAGFTIGGSPYNNLVFDGGVLVNYT